MPYSHRKRPPGLIVPTALFVAMFVMVMATVLVSRISQDFGNSLSELERTELKYISLGAVNQLLSDMNTGKVPRDKYTRLRPDLVSNGGRITESWVEPVPVNEDFVFVVARTYRESGGLVEEVRKFATFRPKINEKIYASVADKMKGSPDPIYFSDSGGWSMLASIPLMRYTDAGELRTEPGKYAGSTPFYVGARDHSVYAIYAPTLDGWNDPSERAFFLGIPIPLLRFNWGDFVLDSLVTGTGQTQTQADLNAVVPLIHEVRDPGKKLSLSRGAVVVKYSHETNEWSPLPPAPEATFDGEKFVEKPGDFWVQGVPGPMSATAKGVIGALARDGQDAIYEWNNDREKWEIYPPPGRDVLALAVDQGETTYVQTGELKKSDIGILLAVLAKQFRGVKPNTYISRLHKRNADGTWTGLDNPPARFFTKDGVLKESNFGPSGGPLLGSMVGGERGELYIVSRPSEEGFVDTIYRLDEDGWEAVPSPPNRYYDGGLAVEEEGLPDRLDIALAAGGEITVRLPTDKGGDAIFTRDEEGQYRLLPAVQAAGESTQDTIYQISGGGKADESGRGTYLVKATYF